MKWNENNGGCMVYVYGKGIRLKTGEDKSNQKKHNKKQIKTGILSSLPVSAATDVEQQAEA